jgi:hypothetical protein
MHFAKSRWMVMDKEKKRKGGRGRYCFAPDDVVRV